MTRGKVITTHLPCRNLRRTAFGNYSATMYWPVRVPLQAIAQGAAVMVGCTGLTMKASRWMICIGANEE